MTKNRLYHRSHGLHVFLSEIRKLKTDKEAEMLIIQTKLDCAKREAAELEELLVLSERSELKIIH